MQKTKFKILIAFLTFIVGVTVVLSVAYRNSIFQNSNITFSNNTESDELEEYAVYSALLNEMFVKDGAKFLVISDYAMFQDKFGEQELSLNEKLQRKEKYYPSVAEDTFIDFDAKSTQSSKLKSNFNLSVKYVLINEDELTKNILANEEEKEKDKKEGKYFLYDKYPDAGGLISFSKVGFNKEKNQAFVEVELTFCGLCGSGDYVLLQKEQGIWKVKEIFNRWVS